MRKTLLNCMQDVERLPVNRLGSSLSSLSLFTSPARAVAKYRNEHVCVCVSVCPRALSPEPHSQSLPNCFCMLPIAVARSSCAGLTQSQAPGERGNLGVFLPY